MASSSDALPPEFLQRAQQGGIVVTGRPSFPFCPEKLSSSLLTPPFADIPKLDLESYIQNYRGTWSSPAAVCLHPR